MGHNWRERLCSKSGRGHRLLGVMVWKPRGRASSDWGPHFLGSQHRILKDEEGRQERNRGGCSGRKGGACGFWLLYGKCPGGDDGDDDLPKDRRHDRSGKEQTEGFRVDMALLSVGSSPIQRDGAGLAR